MQIVALQDALADQNYMLQQIALNHTLPLSLKSINCTNISNDDINVLKASISKIQQDLNEIGNVLKYMNSTNQSCSENVKLEYEWAVVYLQELKQVSAILNKCPTPQDTPTFIGIGNVTNYANISNLAVPNWIYGNQSSSQFYIRMFKFITSHNITTCP